MGKLTNKQKKFVDEYLIDLNGTQAAIRAGYSEKTANRIASENLTKLDVQLAIQEKQKEIRAKSDITRKAILDELKKVGFFDTEVIETKDKIKALEIISKMLGYDRPEESSSNGMLEGLILGLKQNE